MRILNKTLLSLALIAGLPSAAYAESKINTGVASPLTASAKVDFQITVPKVIYLRVGTGSNLADNATVNLIDFTVPAANIGDGTVVNASALSGDLGAGAVTARVIGNNGDVTLSSTTLGALNNGSGDTVSYSNITTTASTLVTPTALPAPALADAATTSISVSAVGKIVNRDASWLYRYANSSIVAPGTYGGVNAQNGRVTYTASIL